MVNGLYTSAVSMMHLQKKQDVISNNLANANTTGFKKSMLLTNAKVDIKRNDEQKLHQDEDQNLDEVYTDFSQGPLVQTDNGLDIAISGDALFSVETEDGTRYTRNGSFSLNAMGELVTLSGDPVLNTNGGRILLNGQDFSVLGDGGLFVKGTKIGQLGMFEFENKNMLLARGKGYFENLDEENNSAESSKNSTLKQGFLETSNVNTVESMVQMIIAHRNYEASQKALMSSDDTLKKAVNEVGRVG
ncbi:MAG: flagellar basal-body rod protein FlgF [Fibrobacteria bacterium]|nr:flagellar basal-body rod protein FlgF [Fibrobacteria bacterium]